MTNKFESTSGEEVMIDIKRPPKTLPQLINLVRARIRSSWIVSSFLTQRLIWSQTLPPDYIESFLEHTGDYLETIGVARSVARNLVMDGAFIYPGKVVISKHEDDKEKWYLKDPVLLYRLAAEVDIVVLQNCLDLFAKRQVVGNLDLRLLVSDIRKGYEMLGEGKDIMDQDPFLQFIHNRLPLVMRISLPIQKKEGEAPGIDCQNSEAALEILTREMSINCSLTMFCMTSAINGGVASVKDFLPAYWNVLDILGDEKNRVEKVSGTFSALHRRYLPWKRTEGEKPVSSRG